MFRRDPFIIEVGGFLEGLLEDLACGPGGFRFQGPSSPKRRQRVDLTPCLGQDFLAINANLVQHRNDDTFAVGEQGGEHMEREQFAIAVFRGEIVGALQRFLRLGG